MDLEKFRHGRPTVVECSQQISSLVEIRWPHRCANNRWPRWTWPSSDNGRWWPIGCDGVARSMALADSCIYYEACLWQTPLPDNCTSATPHQQPGVVYVVRDANNGQIVLPAVTGSGQENAEDAKKTFIPHIILSCIVFWMFGCLFGLIAFILASK